MSQPRTLVLFVAVCAIVAFYFFDLGVYFRLDYLQGRQAQLTAYVASAPLQSAAAYFCLYVLVTALSLPGALVLTLVGGGIFGLIWGTILVSVASTLGATAAFLVSRYLFRDAVGRRFQSRMAAIDKGIVNDGAFYLFTLRLVPLFPFFVINLLMGLTAIKAWTFLFVSQAGMFPATLVFVNAGTQIAKIDSLGSILSPGIIASFAALGAFPLIARSIVARVKARRILKPYAKPKRFDRNLIVIGAGSAGLVSSYLGAATKARVTLVEKHRMGGDCLNTGCVPSKALLRTAKAVFQARHGERYGIASSDAKFDFSDVMDRIKRVIGAVEPHDSVERYTALGVECLSGEAKILTPYCVSIDDRKLTTRNIVIAAGARPFVPPIPGLDQIKYLTSDNLWDLRELPRRLVVLGGGPIGCEISQAFARLGAAVTQIEMAPRLLMREDEVVSATVLATFEREGITVELNLRAVEFRQTRARKTVVCETVDRETADVVEFDFDHVVVALGRRANVEGYGLEELGISLNANGSIKTNKFLATDYANIYACGDVTGPYQFTHVAAHQAWYATVNGLFGGFKRFAVDYSVIPWCTFTDPEVARVGLNELDAAEQGIAYELTSFAIDELDRAIADEVAYGCVRVLTKPGKDTILGATIVAEHAGDLIAEFVLAMKHGLGLGKILSTIHIYPTLAEANKHTAGAWRRAHIPTWLLACAARYHRWQLHH
ncbi:MAG: pyridine nucleotide-disulfide oxidoreductase [Proteobacteria bacterium]|nr:MAG: pyridine nucleotide-disulfide oxidoreductase [Pseudomonadota bacterium]